MADLTSNLNSLSDLLGSIGINSTSQSQVDLLVEAFRKTQSKQLTPLNDRKSTLEKKSQFFASLNSKIQNLVTYLDKFSLSTSSDLFISRTVLSSDTSIVTASANSNATLGINTIKVNRLASNDILISARLTSTDTFAVSGNNLNFVINGKSISVNIEPNTSNQNALSLIANTINNTSDINVTASVIKDTSSTVRLTLTAKNPGQSNNITFNDNGSGVLNALGFDNVDPNATIRTPTNNGEEYAHYKIANVLELNSQFEINGLTITRESNTIDDVLTGITINLLKPQETNAPPVILTTDVDTTAVENVIKPLLDAYNDLLQFLDSNRNLLKDEPLLRNLGTSLKVLTSQEVTSAQTGNPKFLYEVGLKVSPNGTLSISDRSKLTDALKSDYKKVADLFTSSDSFVAKINNVINFLKGDSGYITTKSTNVRNQINQVQKRITELQNRIDILAENYRTEYVRTLEVYLKAQSQYTRLLDSSYQISNYSF
ncbi:MAG: flagellar filament capping protein FliD [Candidatus Kapaibacteriales bacterium]